MMFNAHPIQISTIIVRELSIKALKTPSSSEIQEGMQMEIGVKAGEFNDDQKTIEVSVKAQTPRGDEGYLYNLCVEITGVFKVDTDRFKTSDIKDWSRRNAPYILFPYLREQVYSLTLRCGFAPAVFPLMELPTFKMEPLPQGELGQV